ncbi:MAG: Fic/DOC family N-terminal domain-containing protein [Syntrophomonadaceae bacterium]|nr:Fic/DOC family N-terminal domain-containing protein [Syntrophomonadaceae bacterium]
MDRLKPFNDLKPISRLEVEENKALLKQAEDTRVAIEILNYEINSLPNPSILLDTLSLQEAKASSNIENIFTTNDDLYRGIVFDSFTAEAKEVSRYKDALFIGFNNLKEKGILSISDIESINEPVNKRQRGIRANLPEFESSYTRIANVSNGQNEILYTPPHGKELLNKLLVDMLEYVYDDEMFPAHPLVKIALAHYQFESIHPFYDGNGRTGRILNILLLCQKGYLSYPILYASSYIIKNKNEYYALLQICRQEDNYPLFIKYMLSSFETTAKKTLQMVNNIKSLMGKYSDEEFLKTLRGQKPVLRQVMELIFKKVYIRIEDLVELGVHRQTASSYLQQLVDQGLLQEEKIQRDKVFKNIELLKLFEGE